VSSRVVPPPLEKPALFPQLTMVRPMRRFAPLQPSNLRFLSGPSSPASPILPIASCPRFFSSQTTRSLSSSSSASSTDSEMFDPPPMEPMPWLWCCHVCSSHFPLGATRRCLNDGHHFCGGTTLDGRTGRVRRHKSCQSEFDYRSWGQWGTWKRDQLDDPPAVPSRKNCGKHCNFPSECRFTKKRVVRNPGLGLNCARPNGYASLETLAAVAALAPTGGPVSAPPVTVTRTEALDPAASILFPTAPNTPAPSRPPLKRSGYTVERLVPADEKKRSAHIAPNLSPIQEERSARSSPTTASRPGVSLPQLQFSSFPASLTDFQSPSFLSQQQPSTDPVKALDALNQEVMDFEYDADIDTETSPETASPVSPLTPSPQELALDVPSILSLQNYINMQNKVGRRGRLDEVSPRKNARPGGSIGGALTPPSTPKPMRGTGYESGDEMEI